MASKIDKIKKYIIKSSPYGETNIVLEGIWFHCWTKALDLAKLVDDIDVNSKDTIDMIKEHNEEHFAVVLDPESNSFVTIFSATVRLMFISSSFLLNTMLKATIISTKRQRPKYS